MKFKCIPQEDGLELFAKIHGGICGSHIGSRALVGKAFRQGFSPRNSYTGHLECLLTMKLSKSGSGKTTCCSLRKIVFGRLCELRATSKLCATITAAKCLEEGDLALWCIQSAKGSNKLTPKWEGPYRVVRVTRPGAVRLETEDGTLVQNSWNIEHLRKFYP